ncbi:MAG: hypothetical protein QOG56_2540, partial [Solirubrobacteraceae bacterium]|nr:hypothetical protein [Solirubrobacteraceae bacterium]
MTPRRAAAIAIALIASCILGAGTTAAASHGPRAHASVKGLREVRCEKARPETAHAAKARP